MIDFDGAENWLKVVREAHEKGDEAKFSAARHLLAISLEIVEAPPEKFLAAQRLKQR